MAVEVPITGATAPAGPAGGVLDGDYPDPSFADNMATQAELDSVLDSVPRFVRGEVSSTGAVVLGSGFTVAKNAGSGDYTISFITAFPVAPIVIATAGPSTGTILRVTRIHSVSTTSVRITIRNDVNNLSDNAFHFIAMAV